MADPNKILVSWPSSDTPLPSEPGPAEYPGDERPACKPFICSNDLLDADGRIRDEAAAAELRRRSAACGYVYFEELLPPAQVLEVRRAFVQILDDAGWLDAGRDDPLSTRARQTPLGTKLEGQDEYRPIMRAFQSLESFHSLSKSPRLLGVLDALFDEPTFVHPRNIGRIILPQKNDFKTMPHQDWVHIQGCANTVTGWLPLGDVSVDDGGLAVLEGSSRFGVRRHWNKDLLGLVGGAGGIGVTCKQLEERGCVWKTAEYKAGDMLLFNSLAIHQALPNLSDDIRLSCDFRYSGLSKEVVPDGLLPHGNIAPCKLDALSTSQLPLAQIVLHQGRSCTPARARAPARSPGPMTATCSTGGRRKARGQNSSRGFRGTRLARTMTRSRRALCSSA